MSLADRRSIARGGLGSAPPPITLARKNTTEVRAQPDSPDPSGWRPLLTRPSAATQEGFPIRDSEFPKGHDSGIGNLESGIRNPPMRTAGILRRTTLTRPPAAIQEGFPIRDPGFPKGNDSGIGNLESGISQMRTARDHGGRLYCPAAVNSARCENRPISSRP